MCTCDRNAFISGLKWPLFISNPLVTQNCVGEKHQHTKGTSQGEGGYIHIDGERVTCITEPQRSHTTPADPTVVTICLQSSPLSNFK